MSMHACIIKEEKRIVSKHGGTLDADFKVTINRMRAQLNNAKKSKDF